MVELVPLLTERAPITGYGRGLFRIGGVEHRGSLLILPGGVYAWPVSSFAGVTAASLVAVLHAAPSLGFMLLGTGAAQIFPDRALRDAFAAANMALEAMDTGAACRTCNLLMDEGRVFAAALIALPG